MPDDQSRMDVSIHPFSTSIGYDDVRITTNFGREQPLFAFFSTMHEAGHALYELGLPKGKFKDTVISDAPSLGLHESQSRFWENMIGHSKAFWKYFYPFFQRTFSEQLKKIDFNEWYFYVNNVKPSPIRIEADELTYCLHVILRFEIEMDLMDGKLKVSELPGIWNEKMEEMLGIIPRNDKEGVLQDMHWSCGDFGYFPTYSIGTIYAAQLFNQLVKEKPEVTQQIARGEFKNIIEWLRGHVYEYGRMMTADEIIKKACHERLNPQIFVSYLKEKYYSLYEI
jgi:carboxypeptidase Taq